MAEDTPFNPYFAVGEAAVADVAFGLAVDCDDPFEAGLYKFAVGRGLIFNETPVDDQAIGLFGEIEAVSEFGFRVGLAAYENVNVGVVEAEDLFLVENAVFANNALVCLVDGLGKLIEDALDAVVAFDVGLDLGGFEHLLDPPRDAEVFTLIEFRGFRENIFIGARLPFDLFTQGRKERDFRRLAGLGGLDGDEYTEQIDILPFELAAIAP